MTWKLGNCRLKSDGLVWHFWHGQPGGRGGVWGGVVSCWGVRLLHLGLKTFKLLNDCFQIVTVQGSGQAGGGLDQWEEFSRVAPPQDGNGTDRTRGKCVSRNIITHTFKVDCMLEQLKTMEGNLARYDLFTSTTICEYFDGDEKFPWDFLQAEQGWPQAACPQDGAWKNQVSNLWAFKGINCRNLWDLFRNWEQNSSHIVCSAGVFLKTCMQFHFRRLCLKGLWSTPTWEQGCRRLRVKFGTTQGLVRQGPEWLRCEGDFLNLKNYSWPSHQEEAAFAVSFRETGTSLLNSLVLKHLPGTWDPGILSYSAETHTCSCFQRSQSQSFQDPGSARQSSSRCWRAGRGSRWGTSPVATGTRPWTWWSAPSTSYSTTWSGGCWTKAVLPLSRNQLHLGNSQSSV